MRQLKRLFQISAEEVRAGLDALIASIADLLFWLDMTSCLRAGEKNDSIKLLKDILFAHTYFIVFPTKSRR
jgi:hypothetical protein